MVPTDLPDPEDPEFAPIRGELARLFVQHKADMDMGDWPDAAIIERVDDICAVLIALVSRAMTHGDEAWLDRHHGQPAMPLDG